MPRRPRGPATDSVYHVLNRAVRRAVLFETESDFAAFEHVLLQTVQRVPLRVLAYSAMSTHWHLVVWPDARGQLFQALGAQRTVCFRTSDDRYRS